MRSKGASCSIIWRRAAGDDALPSHLWAKGFGMLTDKFGVNWMINVE